MMATLAEVSFLGLVSVKPFAFRMPAESDKTQFATRCATSFSGLPVFLAVSESWSSKTRAVSTSAVSVAAL